MLRAWSISKSGKQQGEQDKAAIMKAADSSAPDEFDEIFRKLTEKGGADDGASV